MGNDTLTKILRLDFIYPIKIFLENPSVSKASSWSLSIHWLLVRLLEVYLATLSFTLLGPSLFITKPGNHYY